MVVVLENEEASSVIGSSEAPYINSLASRYGLATQSYGWTHPSLPNYLYLIAGTTFGVTTDCTSCSVEGQTLVDQLTAKGIGWRAYMESAPGPCPTVATTASGYAKRHDPFVYVTHIVNNPSLCNNVVPYTQLAPDLTSGSAPPFLWVTPNVCNDGHDCGIATSDRWLAANLPPVMASSWYRQNGVIILTYDEGSTSAGCCAGAQGGRIVTIVVSARTPSGARMNTPVDHGGTLATIEDLYGVGHLGGAANPASGSLMSLL